MGKDGLKRVIGWVETGQTYLYTCKIVQNPHYSDRIPCFPQNRVEVCRIALKSTESCQNLGRIVYAILARILVILAESRFSEGAQNRTILAESQKRNNPQSCLRDQTSDPDGHQNFVFLQRERAEREEGNLNFPKLQKLLKMTDY